MMRRTNLNAGLARAFADKYPPPTAITVDQFDTFIIDAKLADDPKTTDTKDLRYIGFVQARTRARKQLNTAARQLPPGETFQVVSVKGVDGYQVVREETAGRSNLKILSSRVELFTQNRVRELETEANRLRNLEKEYAAVNPDIPDELLEVNQMMGIMFTQAHLLQRKIEALVSHYNSAHDETMKLVRKQQKRLQAELDSIEDVEPAALEKKSA